MVRWHHQVNGHEFEETLGDSGAWRVEVRGVTELSDMTYQLNNKGIGTKEDNEVETQDDTQVSDFLQMGRMMLSRWDVERQVQGDMLWK